MSNVFTDEELRVLKRILENVKRQLSYTIPGTIDRLDWHFYRKYGESFIEHFLKNPEETYQALLDFYGVDTPGEYDSVKYIIYMTLKTLFFGNKRFTDEAYEAFLKKDWSKLRSVVKKFLEATTTSTTF